MEDTMPKQNDRPVHEVRIGAIKAAIWKNDTANGVRYNATVKRNRKRMSTVGAVFAQKPNRRTPGAVVESLFAESR
jgi:hypothetical protein